MEYAKIIVKNNYEKRGDLVLRSYIRALKQIEINILLENDNGLIYGTVDDSGKFHEFFTGLIIDYDNYIFASYKEFSQLYFLSDKGFTFLRKINEKILFNQDNDLDIEISNIEDLAFDRAIEFEAYNNHLSRINPYQKLSEENMDSFNDYNNFIAKIKEIKRMKLIDNLKSGSDEYEVNSYISKPNYEEDYEYLIFEVPKVLKK